MSRRIFYVSEMTAGTTNLDIQAVVSASIMWNRRHDVTGMLVASPRHFAQILEGRTSEIALVMARIGNDRHHHSIRVQLDEPDVIRRFARWAMALVIRDDLGDELGHLHEADRPASEKTAAFEVLAQASRDFAPQL